MNKVRFASSVKIGDALRVEYEVIDKQDKSGHGGIVSWNKLVKNWGEDVAVDIMKVLIAKR